jgi:rod shape-determining protein MreC
MVETRGGRRFAVLFLVAAFLVLLLGRWLKPVDNVALTIAAPFAWVSSGVAGGIGDEISGITQGPQYRSEVLGLQRQVGLLIHENLMLQEQKHENALLTRMLNFKDLNSHLDLVPARIIATGPDSLSPSVIINRGSRDGVRFGMTIVDPGGYFVGTVSQVDTNASKVLLMVSPSSSVGAIDEKTRATGVVEGVFGSLPRFKFVVTSAALHKGDFVVTSGADNLNPRMILLGQIAVIHHSDVSEFQTADIRPAANFQNLELVQVVRNFSPSEPLKLITP